MTDSNGTGLLGPDFTEMRDEYKRGRKAWKNLPLTEEERRLYRRLNACGISYQEYIEVRANEWLDSHYNNSDDEETK